MDDKPCVFCEIARGSERENVVFEDEKTIAFLDKIPVYHGHCIIIPKEHYETLMDLPDDVTLALFKNTKRLSKAVMTAMEADGILNIINNIVSQSIPHLHVHVMPRKRGDGLKGFMWPRRPYKDEAEKLETARKIKEAMKGL